MRFNRFKTFIFDLDGTVWYWNRLVPGAKATIARLQKSKRQVIFMTNNSILSRQGLAKKLKKFGIKASKNDVINSTYVAAKYFKNKLRGRSKSKKKVLAFGKGLKEELKQARIKITNKLPADYVVIGHDLRFDYMKLLTAFEALNSGAKLYGTARGNYFPIGNRLYPGTGVIVHAVEYVSGKKAKIFGKPSNYTIKEIRALNKHRPSKTVLIGDELNSDIAVGKKAGYYTVLVRTGIDKRASKRIKPDAIVKSVADIKI